MAQWNLPTIYVLNLLIIRKRKKMFFLFSLDWNTFLGDEIEKGLMNENQVLSMQKQFIARLAIQSCFIFLKGKITLEGHMNYSCL